MPARIAAPKLLQEHRALPRFLKKFQLARLLGAK
jgi:hypothetical protein